jgi:hypothetical protein
MSPSFSIDHYHHFLGHTFDSLERSKSETSVSNDQQRFEIGNRPRRPSLDSASRHRTPQVPLTSTTISFIDTDDIEEESKCHAFFYMKKMLSYHNVEMLSRAYGEGSPT